MGVKCVEGASFHCSKEQTRHFGGSVPAYVLDFELKTLDKFFGVKTLYAWIANRKYHSYYNLGALGKFKSRDDVWTEYKRQPALAIKGRLNSAVVTGQQSMAMAATRSAHYDPVLAPLPGGPVIHVVADHLYCFANVTGRIHLLYPGYILRWLSQVGDIVISNTLGRGVGRTARENEFYGPRIFSDLDISIAKTLGRK
jgi:hypothetical protein